MANHTLTGGLGSGKSIIACGRLRDHMMRGLPCAGNIDFYPEKILPSTNTNIYIRLPDFPSSSDLWNLGRASDSPVEKTFGLLVLDELAVFLNSREWSTKGRDEFIKFLRHVRKQHWHTLFITQDIESLDKQARVALIEHKAVCSRTDRLPIPFIGWILRLIGFASFMPRVHMAIVRYGTGTNAMKVDTWFYAGKSLFGAYDTDQIFTDAEIRDLKPVAVVDYWKHNRPLNNAVLVKRDNKTIIPTSSGAFSTLSAWHLVGRYQTTWQKYSRFFYAISFLIAISYCIFFYFFAPKPTLTNLSDSKAVNTAPKKINGLVNSYYTNDGFFILKLNDGGYVLSPSYTKRDDSLIFKAGNNLYEFKPVVHK